MAMLRDSPVDPPTLADDPLSGLLVCGLGVVVSPQVQLDVCGCKNNPAASHSLDTTDSTTYPPGTTKLAINTMEIPLPSDGVFVFNNVNLVERPQYIGYGLTIRFVRNSREHAGDAAGQRQRPHRRPRHPFGVGR